MNERRPLLALVAALLTLFIGVFYILPRQRQMATMQKDILDLQNSQSAASKLIPEAAEQTGNLAPNPTPNVPGWLTTHAIGGMDKQLISNNPYRNGQGSSLEMRALKPLEVSTLLGKMTQVNLIVKSLSFADFNARGVWDVKLQVEVPAPASGATPTPTPTPTGDKP